MRAFKYFDLNNNGIVEPDEFAKAIEKIGIMIPTRQVSSFVVQSRKIKSFRLTLLFISSVLPTIFVGFGRSFCHL